MMGGSIWKYHVEARIGHVEAEETHTVAVAHT